MSHRAGPVAECPRCGHQQLEPAFECPACGVILAKARPMRERAHEPQPSTESHGAVGSASLWRARAATVLLNENHEEAPGMVGRVVVWCLLLIPSWTLATASVASNAAGESWLHLVNLVFHEAGHVLFLPLGAFMTVLGGSLMQLLVPAILLAIFLTKHRDPFGAAVCGWWLGESLLDLAPYIDDARRLQLVLLGGRTGAEVEGHDWERILMTLGWLHLDHTLGRLAHAAGAAIMLTALAWAALVVCAQWRQRASAADGSRQG